MNELKDLTISIMGIAVSITCSILTLTMGWGLSPHNWAAIIGFGFFGQVLAILLGILAKPTKK